MSQAFDPQYLLGLPPRVTQQRFTRRDTMLYALGVGAGQDPEAGDLHFVYEGGLKALPTMAVVMAYPGFWQMEPEYGIDWKRLLHAEQSVVFHQPLPVEGEVYTKLTIESIVDKGAEKGALLYSLRRLYDKHSNTLLASVTQVSFLRGNGGQGGSSEPAPKPYPIPGREPDFVVPVQVRPEQALIYRLSGDYNPLHADPAVANEAGLPAPILHGLCTYGIAGRVVLQELCGSEPARMKRLDSRFSAVVYPGDALDVALWREADGRAAFQVRRADGTVVINNGYVEFES